ncbi:hypothetical protein JT245_01500 [Helicobacter pylori]|nr:hypothetical protein [Helicobacter pylori]
MFYSIKAHQKGIEVKKALSITSKIAIGILAILGVYALVIFVVLKAYHQDKGYRILTFGMIIMTKETYEAYLDTDIANNSKQLEEIRNQKLKKALELCKQSGLVLRKFDGKNFSFECDEPNRSKP